MAERQVLRDAIGIRRINDRALSEPAAALGVFALQQMALASMAAQDLASASDLEPLGHGFLRFDAFGTSHKFINSNYKRVRTICRRTPQRKPDFKVCTCASRLFQLEPHSRDFTEQEPAAFSGVRPSPW